MILRIRERSPVLLILAGIVLAYVALTSLSAIGMAHADSSDAPAVEHVLVSAGPVVQAAAGFDISTAVVVLAIVLGGIGTILGGASTILHAIAARTKTTVDDRAAAAVDAAHAKIDELLALFRAAVPLAPTTSTTTVNVAAPVAEPVAMPIPGGGRRDERGAVRIGLLVPLALAALVMTQVSCSGTTGQRAAAGVQAAIDCEDPQLKAAAASGWSLAQAAILSTISGGGHPDAAAFKSAIGGIKDAGLMCAVAGVVAALATPAPKSSVMASGLEVDADELRAVYASARSELGWPQIKAAP